MARQIKKIKKLAHVTIGVIGRARQAAHCGDADGRAQTLSCAADALASTPADDSDAAFRCISFATEHLITFEEQVLNAQIHFQKAWCQMAACCVRVSVSGGQESSRLK